MNNPFVCPLMTSKSSLILLNRNAYQQCLYPECLTNPVEKLDSHSNWNKISCGLELRVRWWSASFLLTLLHNKDTDETFLSSFCFLLCRENREGADGLHKKRSDWSHWRPRGLSHDGNVSYCSLHVNDNLRNNKLTTPKCKLYIDVCNSLLNKIHGK